MVNSMTAKLETIMSMFRVFRMSATYSKSQ